MMKCDELKKKYSDITGPYYGYNEVNEAIEEMKTEHHKERHEYIKIIAELKEERRWRKCSEEKPGNKQKVLVWLTAGGHYGFVLTSMYIDGQWFYGEDPQGCKPSHWMPLPSAPEDADK